MYNIVPDVYYIVDELGVFKQQDPHKCDYCGDYAIVRISWKDPMFADNPQEHEAYMCLSHEKTFELGTSLGGYYDEERL
jgi:hypothetical protein